MYIVVYPRGTVVFLSSPFIPIVLSMSNRGESLCSVGRMSFKLASTSFIRISKYVVIVTN